MTSSAPGWTTAAATSRAETVIALPPFSLRATTVTLQTVDPGKLVIIDGLAVSRS